MSTRRSTALAAVALTLTLTGCASTPSGEQSETLFDAPTVFTIETPDSRTIACVTVNGGSRAGVDCGWDHPFQGVTP